ncbi:MAG: autotransporter outer membrane beta-barrel domain-containing protein [Phascolarctobacterium faecium]
MAGNYIGDNGQLHMNVVLGKDDSATDKMIVGGDTSGTTYINFKNIGGSGAQTAQGIKVIEVLGNSDGNFIKSNPWSVAYMNIHSSKAAIKVLKVIGT